MLGNRFAILLSLPSYMAGWGQNPLNPAMIGHVVRAINFLPGK